MAGSRERLLYSERRERSYATYEPKRPTTHDRYSRKYNSIDRPIDGYTHIPKRKNGYVFEDIYSDFEEAQGRLSLFRPIRPEYLNLPTSYDTKYNSLPRNYYHYDERDRKYKKDYYDFRIENDRRRPRIERTYEPYRRQYELTTTTRRVEIDNRRRVEPKNVAVCKPMRVTEKQRYWTTEPPKKPKKTESEPKKNVKFSEVSGCNRKTVIDDPITGRKVVPVRELEVSLDQMIQNGYFEKHNIPINPVVTRVEQGVKRGGEQAAGSGGVGGELPLRRPRNHLPQVSVDRWTVNSWPKRV